jgi:hypothetical protein
MRRTGVEERCEDHCAYGHLHLHGLASVRLNARQGVDGDRRVTVRRWWYFVVVVNQDLNDEEALAIFTVARHEFLIAAKAEAFDATVCDFRRRQALAGGGF